MLLERYKKGNQRMHSYSPKTSRNSLRIALLYGAHEIALKRLERESCRAIVCTILFDRKRVIILNSSKVCLKCTNFFITKYQSTKKQ